MSDSLSDVTDEARTAGGGPVALAKALSALGDPISSQAVSKWTRVPAERVLDVEQLSGVSRYRLRPDVFGPAPGTAADPHPFPLASGTVEAA